jgi:hypothetical protein
MRNKKLTLILFPMCTSFFERETLTTAVQRALKTYKLYNFDRTSQIWEKTVLIWKCSVMGMAGSVYHPPLLLYVFHFTLTRQQRVDTVTRAVERIACPFNKEKNQHCHCGSRRYKYWCACDFEIIHLFLSP